MKESLLFLAYTLPRWRTTGAIAPSGRSLARAVAGSTGPIAPGQVIVELGPGTGVTTRELVKRFPNNRIVAVEIIDAFAAALQRTFPTVTVVRGDASQLDVHLKALGIAPEDVGAVTSGLPLLAFPGDVSRRILAAVRGVLQPGRRYVQFTYSRRAWRRFVVEGFTALPTRRVWLNVPPANVLTFERTADAPHPMTPPTGPLPLEPMDPQLRWIQPGGGVVCRLELAWGRWRRFWLKTFRPGYVRRMAATRRGDANGCPHEVIDPRDVKFYRNQVGYSWAAADDPFRWRDRIPFARAGLAELLVFSALTFGPCVALLFLLMWPGMEIALPLQVTGWLAAATLAVIGGLVVWFFRDPPRRIPAGAGLVVSPADGKVVAIDDIEDDDFVGGPAVRIGIFLSIFNVHINRAPVAGRVIGVRYKPGKYLNALRPESARENEQVSVRMQESAAPHRRYVVRQITGAIARRIVCWLKPGDELGRGEQFGMIKLGSRTELILPRAGATMRTKLGDKVKAGRTVLVEYGSD